MADADRTMKAGDTWPPLDGAAGNADGLYDLTTADEIKVLIQHSSGTPSLVKVATVIDPLTNDGNNWRVFWNDTDTDVIGTYKIEVEINWDNASTPQKIQTIPNTGTRTLVIEDDLGGTY